MLKEFEFKIGDIAYPLGIYENRVKLELLNDFDIYEHDSVIVLSERSKNFTVGHEYLLDIISSYLNVGEKVNDVGALAFIEHLKDLVTPLPNTDHRAKNTAYQIIEKYHTVYTTSLALYGNDEVLLSNKGRINLFLPSSSRSERTSYDPKIKVKYVNVAYGMGFDFMGYGYHDVLLLDALFNLVVQKEILNPKELHSLLFKHYSNILVTEVTDKGEVEKTPLEKLILIRYNYLMDQLMNQITEKLRNK